MTDLEIIDEIQKAFVYVLDNNHITNDSQLFRKIHQLSKIDKKIIKNYYQIIDSNKEKIISSLHKGELTIEQALHEISIVTYNYTSDEIRIIANDVMQKVPVKKIARIRSVEFNRNGSGLIKKVRQIKRSLDKGFSIQDIIDKKTTEKYNKQPQAMRQIKFYKQEEIDEMVSLIKDPTVNMHNVCLKLAKKHGRSHNAVKVKMYQLRRKLETGKELKRIITIEPKKNVKQKLNFQSELIVEQQPADIGVDVPHGMTFEGKPKRITLHSDHFRIYF